MRKVLALFLSICILLTGCTGAKPAMAKAPVVDSGSACAAQKRPHREALGVSDSGAPAQETTEEEKEEEPELEEEPEEEEPEEEPAPEPVGVAGSNIFDLIVNLENSVYAIPAPTILASRDQTVSTYTCGSSAHHQDYGMTVSYNISSARNLALIYGEFEVDTSFVRGENALRLVSRSYFSMCATMPCDGVRGAYAGQPRAWVESVMDNLESYSPGVSAVFGDASYTLNWSRTEEGEISSMRFIIAKVAQAEDGAAKAE